jgi:hypothetical protein
VLKIWDCLNRTERGDLSRQSNQVGLGGSRRTGIDRAWRLEVELVQMTGKGTAPWTDAEIQEILAGKDYRDLNKSSLEPEHYTAKSYTLVSTGNAR